MADRPIEQYTIPIARVQSLLALAESRGWDSSALLAEAHISAALLREGRSRVTSDQVAVLLRASWDRTDDELLGLGHAPVPRGSFRLLMCATLARARTLRETMQAFVDFNRALPGTPNATLDVGPTEAILTFDLTGVEQKIDILVDSLLWMTHRVLEWCVGGRIPLNRVELPYAPPSDAGDCALAGPPIVFDAPNAAFAVDVHFLEMPVAREGDDLDAFLRNAPKGLLRRQERGTSTKEHVRRIIARNIGRQSPTADEIAAQMAISPQTLRRKLSAEGSNVRQIRDEIFRDTAIELLTQASHTTASVSQRLGFSEPSVFIRAFRRWTGSPPGMYQKRAAQSSGSEPAQG